MATTQQQIIDWQKGIGSSYLPSWCHATPFTIDKKTMAQATEMFDETTSNFHHMWTGVDMSEAEQRVRALVATKESTQDHAKPTEQGGLAHGMTFGFEMTGIPQFYQSERFEEAQIVAIQAIAQKIQKQLVDTYPTVNCHPDGHCVEVSSPVFKTWKEALDFYGTVHWIFRDYCLIPKNSTAVCGGGHLHFGNLTNEQKFNVVSI
jgi:hypothetical protein